MHWIIDYWQVVTNHILKYLMLPCKTCCISAHHKQFDFMGITSARKCSIQFVQLCLKSKKHFVARILFQEHFRHSQDRNTHPLFFFWSPVISGNTIKCHLYPPNVRFWPRPNRSSCLEKQKYHKHVLPPPKKTKIRPVLVGHCPGQPNIF